MRKILLILILLLCFLCSVTVVSAEETKWQVIDEWSLTLHGTSDNDNHEDKSREIQPAPQPALDLPFDRVFYITTLLICLIVMFPAKKTISQLCVNLHQVSTPTI